MKGQATMFALDVPLAVRLRCNVPAEECDACRYYGKHHRYPYSDQEHEVCLTDLWRERPWMTPASWNFGPGHRGYSKWNGPQEFWRGRDAEDAWQQACRGGCL